MAGGFVLLPKKDRCTTCPPIQEYLLELKAQETDIYINHNKGTALIKSVQTFYNPTNKRVEGQFVFPFPPNADPSSLGISINGRPLPSQKLSADAAIGFIQNLVLEQETPELLEFIGQDLYLLDLPSLATYSDVNIKMTYLEPLSEKDGLVEFIYPINLYQSNRIPIANVVFDVEVESGFSLSNLYSPTHPIEAVLSTVNKGVCRFEENNFLPTSDFVLQFSTATQDLEANMMSFKEVQTEEGYFQIEISPAIEMQSLEIIEKDITFVLDCSGSMVGEKMEQAKRALSFCVENLNKGDRFNIVTFSTKAESLYNQFRPYNEQALIDAKSYISLLKATGGTNMEKALHLALRTNKQPNRPNMVVFITDGKPTLGITKVEPLIGLIKKLNTSKAKIFTFGIGDDLNTRLLERIVEETKSYLTYIGTGENIELKVSSFYTKVSSPVLTDVSLQVEGIDASNISPEDIPDLYMGNPLIIYGKYQDEEKTRLTLSGNMKNGERRQFTYDLEFNETSTNDYIPPIWASRRIGAILVEMQENKETSKLKTELAVLARRYGILTPYTVHLVAEEEKKDKALPNLLVQNNFSKDLLENTKETYLKMLKEQEGANSVQSSRSINKMIQATTLHEIAPAQDKLNIEDKKGNIQIFAQQIKTCGGRAFYQTQNGWIDGMITNDMKVEQRLLLNSPQYYQLLEESPQLKDYYALGKKVRFVFEGKYYEVFEE